MLPSSRPLNPRDILCETKEEQELNFEVTPSTEYTGQLTCLTPNIHAAEHPNPPEQCVF